jgi:pseudouridine synthase, RluA family
MEMFTIAVEKEDIGKRIDSYIALVKDELSRSQVQKLIENENILVNSKAVKSNYKLRKDDVLDISIPDPEPLEILAEDIPLEILYEDKHLIVVNKPQGMVVHPAPGHYTGTLVNALMFHCAEDLSGINGCMRPGIVHRIDKDTSGVLMVAKSDMAHRSLALQLAEHTITRKYNAIVLNNIKEDSITVDKPIARNPKDRKKMAINMAGRHAVTHVRVIERIGQYCLIEAQLETGRTHQIRVHLSSIGHPLLGDEVYGTFKQSFKLKGQVLHARILGFIHPETGEYMEFEAPLPDYFVKLIERLRQQIYN